MNPEFIISVSSVIIAIVALIVGVWQGFVTRQHNRLSVKPHLRIDRSDVESIKIILCNTGVGPAIIETFELRIDGETVSGDRMTRMHAILKRLGIMNVNVRFGTLVQEEAIAVGEKYILFEIKDGLENHKEIISVLPRLTFSISYKSIYGEKFTLSR